MLARVILHIKADSCFVQVNNATLIDGAVSIVAYNYKLAIALTQYSSWPPFLRLRMSYLLTVYFYY